MPPETTSPEDLGDTSDKGGVVQEEEELLEDNMERIFVPEHKNQATSPSHPMAHPEEEYAVVVQQTAADIEVTVYLIWVNYFIMSHSLPHCPFDH